MIKVRELIGYSSVIGSEEDVQIICSAITSEVQSGPCVLDMTRINVLVGSKILPIIEHAMRENARTGNRVQFANMSDSAKSQFTSVINWRSRQ